MTTGLVLLLVLLIVIVIGLGEPLYVLIGAVAGFLLLQQYGGSGEGILADLESLTVIVEMTRRLSDNEILLAIPFFIISGAIMSEGDIARRLIRFARAAFGEIPGGLAVSAVFACIFFAAISGSSPVTVIAIGSVMFPAMVKEGYNERFSAGLVTSAGSLGILIPPSIPMILYDIIDPKNLADPPNYEIARDATGSGLVELFMAGIGPGILIGVILASYSVIEGQRRIADQFPDRTKAGFLGAVFRDLFVAGLVPFRVGGALATGLLVDTGARFFATVGLRKSKTWRIAVGPINMSSGEDTYTGRIVGAFRFGFWAMMLPVVILGGIYSGIFTPTQAAAVSVVYALVVEFYIHRSLDWSKIPKIFSDAAVLIGALLIIVALAQGFNKYLELAEVAQAVVERLLEWQLTPIAFLLIVNVLLLIVGCFMDILSAILILVPLLSPVAFQLGIHPMHLAVIFIVNLEIGYLTPPLGLNLFVASTMFKKSLGEMIRAVVPFTGLMLVGLMLITYVPTISLGIVSLKNGHGLYVPFPERNIPLIELETLESIEFLSGVYDREQELEQEMEEAAAVPDRPLTMEEIMANAQQTLQDEALDALLYESVGQLLEDFRLVNTGRVRLSDLALARELGLDLDDIEPDDIEPDGTEPDEPGQDDNRP